MLKIILKKKLILLAALAAVVLIFWSSMAIENLFYDLASFFKFYIITFPLLSVFIFILLAAMSGMFVFFSSIWLIPFAVVIWGDLFTAILLLLGWLIGGTFAYLIGRYAGYPIMAKLTNIKKVDYYRDLLFEGRAGFGLLVLARFVLPSELPSFVLGVARFHFGKYFLITLLAEIPYAFMIIYIIDAILEKDPLLLLIWSISWFFLALTTFYLFYKKFRKGHKHNPITNL